MYKTLIIICFHFILSLSILLSGPNLRAESVTPEEGCVGVGLRKQLFVDDRIMAKRTNLKRVLGKPRKENGGKPVIVPDQPWEDAWPRFASMDSSV